MGSEMCIRDSCNIPHAIKPSVLKCTTLLEPSHAYTKKHDVSPSIETTAASSLHCLCGATPLEDVAFLLLLRMRCSCRKEVPGESREARVEGPLWRIPWCCRGEGELLWRGALGSCITRSAFGATPLEDGTFLLMLRMRWSCREEVPGESRGAPFEGPLSRILRFG